MITSLSALIQDDVNLLRMEIKILSFRKKFVGKLIHPVNLNLPYKWSGNIVCWRVVDSFE